MPQYYFDKQVQETIKAALSFIHGREHKEDAEMAAYEALACEQPISPDDACDCARQAIERYKNRVRKIARHEVEYCDNMAASYDESGPYNYSMIPQSSEPVGSDNVSLEPAAIDKRLFLDTERHSIPHLSSMSRIDMAHERAEAKERGERARMYNR